MQKYHVRITRTAESDIKEIFDYLAADKRSAAIKWLDEIEHQINSLETSPLRCSVIPETGELGREYRHVIFGNFRTIFRIEGTKTIIMRVIHEARLLDLRIIEKG